MKKKKVRISLIFIIVLAVIVISIQNNRESNTFSRDESLEGLVLLEYEKLEQDFVNLFSVDYYSDDKVHGLKNLKLSLVKLKREAKNAKN